MEQGNVEGGACFLQQEAINQRLFSVIRNNVLWFNLQVGIDCPLLFSPLLSSQA